MKVMLVGHVGLSQFEGDTDGIIVNVGKGM